MSLAEAREAIGFFESFVKAIKLTWQEGKGAWNKTQITPLVAALRTVYFPKSGSLSVLERIARGDEVSPDEAQAQLGIFDRDEPSVQEALRQLAYDANFERKYLPLDALDKMDAVAYGKLSVRRGVRNVLSCVAQGQPVDRNDVERTVSAIKDLNLAVSQLDAMLNS